MTSQGPASLVAAPAIIKEFRTVHRRRLPAPPLPSSPPSSAPVAVFVPVGPGPLEMERLVDLADSIAAHEAGPGWFVMIDDAPAPRGLDDLVSPILLDRGSRLEPVALHHLRANPVQFRHGGGLCSSVLMALQWVQANTDARLLLKLDTDSLVIGPFSAQLRRLFDENPCLGMAGAHSLTPNLTHRDWVAHAATVLRLAGRTPFDWRRPLRSVRRSPTSDGPAARVILTALDRGYDPGEHCLGGGYALSRAVLDRMADAGFLEDPMAWVDVDLAEDVMVGAHVRATGMTLGNHVRPGEVFGVRYQGLPALPEALVELGYAVIHAVKNDPRIDEASIRAFFKARRASSTAPAPAGLFPAAAWRKTGAPEVPAA